MRVLIISQYFWPEGFIINDLVGLLALRGVQVSVLTGKPNYPDGVVFEGYRASGVQRQTYKGIPVMRIPILARGRRSSIRLALNYLSFILSGVLFGPRLLRGCAFDLVFVYAPSPLLQALPAMWFARRRRVPLMVWVQDLWPESLEATGYVRNRWALALVALIVRRIYRACARILVPSRAFVAPVATLSDDPAKIRYFPNLYQPVGTQRTSSQAAELVGMLSGYFAVVFAGNLGTAQSLDTLVKAAQLLLPYPSLRIVLVGSGSQDDWLAAQRQALGLTNLVLAGRYDPCDMPAIFDAAQALLVSLRADPAFSVTIPSKVQAYLAAGRPILASIDGEGSRIVQEAEAGLCSAAGDATALALNIRALQAMTPSERMEMGMRGRRYFEQQFEPEALADQLVEHFKELVSGWEKKA